VKDHLFFSRVGEVLLAGPNVHAHYAFLSFSITPRVFKICVQPTPTWFLFFILSKLLSGEVGIVWAMCCVYALCWEHGGFCPYRSSR